MKTHLFAKIFGWLQFAVQVGAQLGTQAPHGVQGWLGTIASGIAAVAIHAASNTDGKA